MLLEIPPCQTPMCGVAYSCSYVLLHLPTFGTCHHQSTVQVYRRWCHFFFALIFSSIKRKFARHNPPNWNGCILWISINMQTRGHPKRSTASSNATRFCSHKRQLQPGIHQHRELEHFGYFSVPCCFFYPSSIVRIQNIRTRCFDRINVAPLNAGQRSLAKTAFSSICGCFKFKAPAQCNACFVMCCLCTVIQNALGA